MCLAGESEQMVSIWTVGAFLSSLDRCVRDWLGRSRSEGCLGSGVMEPLREYSSHEPPQAEGDPSHPCQRHASSGEFHQSFFGQFHHCPSSAETGLLKVPIGDQGAARHPVFLQEEVAVHLSPQDPRQAQCDCGCLVEGCSPPRGVGTPPRGQSQDPGSFPRYAGGPNCHSLECCPQEGLTERLVHSKRQSTLFQQQVAWKAFQEFISQVFSEEDPDFAYLSSNMISRAHVLHFSVWLRTVKNFESQTISNYKALGAFNV